MRRAAVADAPGTRYARASLFRLFLREKGDPAPFYERLAAETIATLPVPLSGRRVLDVGCGAGHYACQLQQAGAFVVSVEIDAEEVVEAGEQGHAIRGDAAGLPVAAGSMDGVFCSNMLEHTPNPGGVIAEFERVLAPGGWAWISWTNWYSPWGGHEIVPLHYLGPRLGPAVWRRFMGEPRKNVPGVGLFPTSIGSVLAQVKARPRLRLIRAYPRYYPSQYWIVKVPGFRELATWNCVLLIEKTSSEGPT
jgi:SAM-dependent methyltransferase